MISLILDFLIILIAIFIALFSESLNLNKNLYIKLFFTLFIISIISAMISYLFPLTIIAWVGSFYMWFAFAFILLHSSKVLGNKKTGILFVIALLFGLTFEAVGVKYGGIFGMPYYYNLPTFFFGLVPISTPISWTIIIYFSYTITNLLLFGFGGEKPVKTDNLWYFLCLMVLLSFISGLIAVNLDMILDPVAVSPQIAGWVWTGGGCYFGIPMGNFIGWFLVAAIALFIFRFYEAISPKSNTSYGLDIFLNLSIVLIYVMYLLDNVVRAFTLGKIEYILIGVTTMMPFILIALLALMLNMKKKMSNY